MSSTKAKKAKGRNLQNTVAQMICATYGLIYGSPGDDDADITGRVMGQSGPDLCLQTTKAKATWPWITLCRNAEVWNSHPVKHILNGNFLPIRWFQEERKRYPGKALVYIFSANNEDIYALREAQGGLIPTDNAIWIGRYCIQKFIDVISYMGKKDA